MCNTRKIYDRKVRLQGVTNYLHFVCSVIGLFNTAYAVDVILFGVGKQIEIRYSSSVQFIEAKETLILLVCFILSSIGDAFYLVFICIIELTLAFFV